MPSPRTVIVGASLAGLRAAEALRRRGQDGPVIVIGAEDHPPYDRPPLSKQVLTAAPGDDVNRLTELTVPDDLDVEWRLGTTVTGLDLTARAVAVGTGEPVPFDQLVIATGAHPKILDGMAAGPRVHVLRTIDDALRLRVALQGQPRVAVIGAGFIGLEVAASCRQLGLQVAVIEALDTPLERAIGADMGQVIVGRHRDHGVRVELGAGVRRLQRSGKDGAVEGIHLRDGRFIEADVIVVGVGVTPTTDWLQGSGVDLDDGVVCDERLRVLAGHRPVPGVVAAGDVVRWHHAAHGETVRIEHWTNATEQAEAAAHTLIEGEQAPAFTPVPYFWSDQFGLKLQFLGRTRPGDRVAVIDGDLGADRWAVAYGRDGILVGALGSARPGRVMKLRPAIESGGPFPPP